MSYKLFELYYNPKIIGKKNIPDNGPTILCGNHLDELDFKLVKCATKRDIVWFDNNLVEAKKQLENNGVVGIFPEGVINIYRLLQFKIMNLEQEIIRINNSKHMRGTDCMTEVARLQTKIAKEFQNIDLIKKQLSLRGIKVNDFDVILPFGNESINLALEFGAKIVPFALTNNYYFRSKDLKIFFGNSYEPQGNDKEEKYNLEEKVRKLIYKNF